MGDRGVGLIDGDGRGTREKSTKSTLFFHIGSDLERFMSNFRHMRI
jgi:hypothetical protein